MPSIDIVQTSYDISRRNNIPADNVVSKARKRWRNEERTKLKATKRVFVVFRFAINMTVLLYSVPISVKRAANPSKKTLTKLYGSPRYTVYARPV